MANGDGFWKDMPWWVKAIAIVGVPSVLSVILVWSDRVQLLARVEYNTALLQKLTSDASTHATVDAAFDADLKRSSEETNRLLLAACINATLDKGTLAADARERCYGTTR
jgi:hypothetical protein